MTVKEFVDIAVNLFRNLLSDRDGELAKATAQVQSLSDQITIMRTEMDALAAAKAAGDEALAAEKLASAQALSVALDEASTLLAASFANPTPVADAFVNAVIENEAIDTEKLENLAETTLVDTAEPTPPVVVETALEALAESVA